MKIFSRLALAALLMGAVSLPALAQGDQTVPAPKPHATGVAPGTETGKTGTHAPAPQTPPVAGAPVSPKSN